MRASLDTGNIQQWKRHPSCRYYGTTGTLATGTAIQTRMKQHKHQKPNCPPLAQNKQRHHNKKRSLLPNGKPSRCRSTAGPEYLSRNGQQPVLGAASSPKPEPIPSGMSPQIHSGSGTCLIQPHWSFWQPISCPSAFFFSINLQRRVADEGVVGIYLGPAISLFTACYCILVCIPFSSTICTVVISITRVSQINLAELPRLHFCDNYASDSSSSFSSRGTKERASDENSSAHRALNPPH